VQKKEIKISSTNGIDLFKDKESTLISEGFKDAEVPFLTLLSTQSQKAALNTPL